jgi:radical SAM superfamily enzyme YgiQ (UPF0313 family)
MATLARERGWEAEVIFEEYRALNLNRLPQADLVGISTITPTAVRAYEIADRYAKLGIPVLMGGPHVTFMPDEALTHAGHVIRGEGETPFSAFMDAFEGRIGWDEVPALSWRNGAENVHNPLAPFATCLEEVPLPDLSCLRPPRRGFSLPIIPVETSRGCPFDCAFCSVNRIFGRRMRFRPVDDVINHLARFTRPGTYVFFIDDNFTAKPAHTKELLQAMIDRNLRLEWSAQVRMDVARDAELLDLMARSGCSGVYTGIETIEEKTLRAVHKQQTIDDVTRGVAALHARGIKVHGMFIFGFDGDDEDLRRRTVSFAKKIRLNTVQFLVLTPLPGTSVFHEMEAEQRIITRDWGLYDAHHVVFRPTSILPYELQRMQIRAHRAFYSLARQITHLLRFNLFELAVALYASRINVRWISANRDFLRWLKQVGAQWLPRADASENQA